MVKKGRLPRLSFIIDMFRRIVGHVVVLLFTWGQKDPHLRQIIGKTADYNDKNILVNHTSVTRLQRIYSEKNGENKLLERFCSNADFITFSFRWELRMKILVLKRVMNELFSSTARLFTLYRFTLYCILSNNFKLS